MNVNPKERVSSGTATSVESFRMSGPWSETEIQLLGTKSDSELGRPAKAIWAKRKALGISAPPSPGRTWAAAHDEVVKSHPVPEAARLLDRSEAAVRIRRRKLLPSTRPRLLTMDQARKHIEVPRYDSAEQEELVRLVDGPYTPPFVPIGARLKCELRGELEVDGYTNALIPWPVTKGHRKQLILCGDLLRALKTESVAAVAFHFGISHALVSELRQRFGVERYTAGSMRLFWRNIERARTADARDKISRAHEGRKDRMKPEDRERLREIQKRPKAASWKERMFERQQRSMAMRRPWTEEEMRLIGTRPDREVARLINRSFSAVKGKKFELLRRLREQGAGGTLLRIIVISWLLANVALAASPRNVSQIISSGPLPHRIHVFEDFETEIEKRWWLRGVPETNNVAASLSDSIPNRRACRATATKDFDDKMGDPKKDFKAVIINPVPGPPMGANTRLSFRYWLQGTDTMRVQIYSLTKNYHRFLTLTNLPQGSWQSAAVDMTQARRPDKSGGPLAEDERIDDLQFYIAPDAELLIDDIVLYDAAPEGEKQLFPQRISFTGWFDTGKQGVEWPGDFEVVPHQPPLTWKAAKWVTNPKTNEAWIRVSMRGERPLSTVNRLRFRYRVVGTGDIRVTLANSRSAQEWRKIASDLARGRWAEAVIDFEIEQRSAHADELRFAVAKGAELQVDDVLLFEPVAEHIARIETDKLRVVIVDNTAFAPNHRDGYSGVAELVRSSDGRNVFVPQYAGLNFEHIFSGDAGSFGWNIFEPRRAPMRLVQHSPTRVELRQEGTEHWPLRSRLTYSVESEAIDFTYCGTPLANTWKKHGYIGLFFASYMNKPEDMSIQFIGRSRPGLGDAKARWIKHLPSKHGVAANHRAAESTWDPPLDDGFNIDLVKGVSDFEFLYPFYVGRSGERMFVMMFERPNTGGEMRFAQSPSGGGNGNPAWDFFWLQRNYTVDQEFCFRARAVYRRFANLDEVIALYEQWSGEKVKKPDDKSSAAKPSAK